MSLLDNSDLIEIKLYYKHIAVGSGKKLVIIDDKKAEELLQDEEKSKGIEVLETNWSMLTWKEQNEVMGLASKNVDPITGEPKFNFYVYRDAIIKKCLRSWNLLDNNQPVLVTSDAIDKLPGPVVIDIYQKFERLLEYSEEELKN